MNEVDDVDFVEVTFDTEYVEGNLQVCCVHQFKKTVSVDSILGGFQDCPNKGI